jgi:hypothetical protein
MLKYVHNIYKIMVKILDMMVVVNKDHRYNIQLNLVILKFTGPFKIFKVIHNSTHWEQRVKSKIDNSGKFEKLWM